MLTFSKYMDNNPTNDFSQQILKIVGKNKCYCYKNYNHIKRYIAFISTTLTEHEQELIYISNNLTTFTNNQREIKIKLNRLQEKIDRVYETAKEFKKNKEYKLHYIASRGSLFEEHYKLLTIKYETAKTEEDNLKSIYNDLKLSIQIKQKAIINYKKNNDCMCQKYLCKKDTCCMFGRDVRCYNRL